MRFTKSQLPGAERKLKEPWPKYGYCKVCRTVDLLIPREDGDICFTCFAEHNNAGGGENWVAANR